MLSFWLAMVWLFNLLVIVGVSLEEEDTIRSVILFVRSNGLFALLKELRSRGIRKSVSKIGFMVLIVGLGGELVSQAIVELKSNSALATANINAKNATGHAADIERKYAWRTVKIDERTKFLNALKGEKFPVVLEYVTSDSEAFDFADQIYKLLKAWNPDVIGYNTEPLTRPRGINISGATSEGRDKMAQAFGAAGIKFSQENLEQVGNEPVGALRVSVGGRFPPTISE